MSKTHIFITGPGRSARFILSGLAVRAAAAPVAVPRDKDAAVTCRDAGVELVMAADQKWEVDVPTKFQWMPGGVSLVTPSYGGRTIRMAVLCDESTARAVQASFDRWRKTMPKQRPFGCVEHREQEAAFLPTHFEWDTERNGVACCGTPTALGAQNVNGRIHRSWSPTFTTDADYESCRCSDCGLGWDGCDAARCEGVMEFPDGVRGSLQNPAQVTGVAFSVGSLTNKPAFRNIDPVRARDGADPGVRASGTSEGARKGWTHRDQFHKPPKGYQLLDHGEEIPSDAIFHDYQVGDGWKKLGSYNMHVGSTYNPGKDDEDDEADHLPMAKPIPGAKKARVRATELETTGAVRAAGTSEGAKKGWENRVKAPTSIYPEGSAPTHGVYHESALNKHGEHAVAVSHHWSESSAEKAKGEGQIVVAYKNTPSKASDPTVKAHCKDNLYADVPDATEAEAAEYDRLVDGGSSHQVAVAELRKKRNPADATVQTSDAILAKLAGKPVTATGTSEGAKKGWESRSKWHTHAGNLSEAASALEVKHHGRSDVDAHVDLRHAHGVAADAWETVAHEAAEHNDKEGQSAYMARSKAHRDQQKRHSEMEDAGRRARRDMPGPWNATDATLTSEQILSRLGGGKTGRTAA